MTSVRHVYAMTRAERERRYGQDSKCNQAMGDRLEYDMIRKPTFDSEQGRESIRGRAEVVVLVDYMILPCCRVLR